MILLSFEEFKKTDDYILFFPLKKEATERYPYMDLSMGELRMKTGKYDDGWNSELPFFPDTYKVSDTHGVSNWCTNDNSSSDYDDSYVFAVPEPYEIGKMIGILLRGLRFIGASIPDWYFEFPDYQEWIGGGVLMTEDEIIEANGENPTTFRYGSCDQNLLNLIDQYYPAKRKALEDESKCLNNRNVIEKEKF